MAASRFTRCTPLFRSLATATGTPARASTFTAPTTSRFPVSSIRRRSFSSTPSTYASEAPPSQSPWEARGFQSEVPLFERLQSHPEVLQSIERLAEIVRQKTGVDLRGGEAPTMKMMYQLAQDPELRQAAEGLMMALRAAGIEVDPKQAFSALQMMGGEGFASKTNLNDLHEAVRKGEGEDGEGEGEGEGEGKGKGSKK